MSTENSSPEIPPPSTKDTGHIINFSRRMETMWNDPNVRQGAAAFSRTILNLGISLADFVPGGPGEILDVIATIAKTIKRIPGQKPDPSKISFDLTPDVPTWVAWAAEAPEVITNGVWPSYAIPTGLQMIRDVPRITEGAKQAVCILKGEVADYQANRSEIDTATNVFKPNE